MNFRRCYRIALGWIIITVFVVANAAQGAAGVKKTPFGKSKEGQSVDLYTLTNGNGMEAAITNYGGTVVSLKTPDRKGKIADVVLGFEDLAGYLGNEPYFGALVGRYGNRIAKARFMLDGHEYRLAQNDHANSLHGGLQGFDEKRRSHPERGETIAQKAEAVLLPINCSQHDGLGNWGQLRVVEIATDTEFSIDGYAHLGRFTQFNGP